MFAYLARENIVFVFDLDGTLMDTAKTTYRVLSNMPKALIGKPATLPPIAPRLSLGGQTLVKTALGPFMIEINKDLLEFRKDYCIFVFQPKTSILV